MFIANFTEWPWQDEKKKFIGTQQADLELSNSLYDPSEGARLYNRYIDERIYCEEVGFDGLMLNEHHSTPGCMQGVTNVGLSILARVTKRVKLVPLGNLLPIWDDPLWLAEQLAMIDMISHGRLVSGWVRGTGRESIVHNVNPTANWERYQEAHDFILKAWTTPGPFRWEGKHYHYRYVNPWAVPLQKPHPPIWIPGLASRSTVQWAAEYGYPYIVLGSELQATKETLSYYHEVAAEHGFKTGTQHVGYVLKVHVDETEELAEETGKKFLAGVNNPFLLGNEGRVRPWVQALPGLSTRNAAAKTPLAAATQPVGRGGQPGRGTYEQQVANYLIISHSPKTVIAKLRHAMETVRPGTMIFWDGDGAMTHDDQVRSFRLFGQEVLPAVREISKELDLTGPFDVDPVAGMTRGLTGMQQATA